MSNECAVDFCNCELLYTTRLRLKSLLLTNHALASSWLCLASRESSALKLFPGPKASPLSYHKPPLTHIKKKKKKKGRGRGEIEGKKERKKKKNTIDNECKTHKEKHTM